MHIYDFIIIGGGAAAFAAATKAHELQAKTLMVNAGLPLGGTCVNVGCVPSSHLLADGYTVYAPAYPRFRGIQPTHLGYPYLETTAAKEGNYATQNALEGAKKIINYAQVPHAVFTSPEVAWVGMTEAEYMQRYHTCSCRTVYLQQVPKALAVHDTRGIVKMVRHHINDKIVGVQICAPLASDMIHEATLAVKCGLTVEDLIDTVHVFPTVSEAIKLAAQAFKRDISKMSCCIE